MTEWAMDQAGVGTAGPAPTSSSHGAAGEARAPPEWRCFDAAGNVVCWTLDPDGALPPAAVRSRLRRAMLGAERPAEILGLLSGKPGSLRARFWNPDGSPERFCGNGMRCVPSLFAGRAVSRREPLVVRTELGPVATYRDEQGWGCLELGAAAVGLRSLDGGDFMVDVGTPHRVRVVQAPGAQRWLDLGRRWSRGLAAVNATFVAVRDSGLLVRTVERGVADETRSCGTGAMAAMLVARAVVDEGLGRDGEAVDVVFISGERLRVSLVGQSSSIVLAGPVVAL